MNEDDNDRLELEYIEDVEGLAHRADQAVAELIDRNGWRATWYERLLEPLAELRHHPMTYFASFVIILAAAPQLGVRGTLLAIWMFAGFILVMKAIDVLLYRAMIRRDRRRERQ